MGSEDVGDEGAGTGGSGDQKIWGSEDVGVEWRICDSCTELGIKDFFDVVAYTKTIYKSSLEVD